ncbi:MAG: glycine zipper domain-containing protein [Candidatus Omnitrophica bacterium]|nr:glycine zipper domain-containing protein [Candidatus Omnitrophota bacterium]
MKKLIFILLIGSLLFTGCSTLENLSPKTKEGAAIGAAMGGILGAILDSNKPWRGAIIGAGIGAIAGGWIGSKMEQKSEEKIVSAKNNIVEQAANEAGKLNAVVKYERVTENGVKEEIVAKPAELKDNFRIVIVEYYRDGKLILKETKQVKLS